MQRPTRTLASAHISRSDYGFAYTFMTAFGCATLPPDTPFAERFAEHHHIPCVAATVTHFPDGEFELQWPPEHLHASMILVASTATTPDQSVHDRLMQLVFGIHQLKTAGVNTCIGVIPYLAYARSDKRSTPTSLMGLNIVMQHLQQAGLDALLTVDVHTPAALHNAFAGPSWSVDATAQMADALRGHLPDDEPLAVCAPDAGAWRRARAWADALAPHRSAATELALVHKQRVHPDQVTEEAFTGTVEGRTVVVVDDMISTGGTMAQAIRACRKRGAKTVWAAVTHGLFLNEAPTRLIEAGLDGLLVANTLSADRITGTPIAECTHYVDVAPLCAQRIDRVWMRR